MNICVGDKITALGHTYAVACVIYQDYYKGNYDVEFLDPNGGYHHWKSEFDGGYVIQDGNDN